MVFKTLILSGGGIKGVAMSSALNTLHENGLLKNINKIIGCSIGAFISLLYTLNYTTKKIEILLQEVNLSKFQDINAKLFLEKYGFDNGEKFIKFMEACMEYQNFNKNITFQELYEKTKIELILVASNVNTSSAEFFSYTNFPELKVIEALKASAGYPFAFVPTQIGDYLYTDGGVTAPFPTNLLTKYEKKKTAIGIVLFQPDKVNMITGLDVYINAIVYSMIKSLTLWNIKELKHKIILSHPISALEFDINDKIREELLNLGREKTMEFIEEYKKNIKPKTKMD